MWKKWLLGLSLSTVLLAGCQGKETVDKQSEQEDDVFTILIGKSDAIDLQEVESTLEGKFGLSVEIEQVSAEKKRRMMLEGKADIVLLAPNEIGFASDEGVLQEVDIQKDSYLSSAVESLRYEGKQYAIPASFEVPVLVYNPSIFGEAPKTMDDFIAHAVIKEERAEQTDEETVKEEAEEKMPVVTKEIVEPYAFYTDMGKYTAIESMLYSYGYSPFKQEKGVYDTSKVSTNTKEARKALETIGFLHNELITTSAFSQKKIVEMYDEAQLYAFIATKEMIADIQTEASVTTLPTIEEGVQWKPSMEVKGWAVTNNVQNKDIIKEFEKIISSESFVQQQLEKDYYTPVHLTWEEENAYIATTYEQAKTSYATPILAQWNELKTPLVNATAWYLEGKLELEEALDAAKQTIDFQLQSNYVYE